jgi:hypothetical protein
MSDPDPTGTHSLDDLAECLRLLHIRAGKPAYRLLEHETMRKADQQLPGSRFKRVRLGRGNITDVLAGRKFPGKAFLLTFVDACGIDLEADRRWEQAWDRLETGRYRRQAAGTETEAGRADVEAGQLRRHLAEAEARARQQLAEAREGAEAVRRNLLDDLRGAAEEAEQLRQQVTDAKERIARQDATTEALVDYVTRNTVVNDSWEVARLLETLRQSGTVQATYALAEHIAGHPSTDDPRGLARLLVALWEAQTYSAADTLAEYAARHAAVDDLEGVVRLLDALRWVGGTAPASYLAGRAAGRVRDALRAAAPVTTRYEVALGPGTIEAIFSLPGPDQKKLALALRTELIDGQTVTRLSFDSYVAIHRSLTREELRQLRLQGGRGRPVAACGFYVEELSR